MSERKKTLDEMKRSDARTGKLKEAPLNCIKLYRTAKHLTQSELAELAGVHRSTIARLETQGGKPHRYLAEEIAKALDISVAQIYGSVGQPPYVDASLFSPTQSGEYLCAFRRSGSHNFNYFVGYFDKDMGTWSLPPWMDFFNGNLPISIKYWMKIPFVVEM